MKAKKLQGYSTLKKKLDRIFSEWVRRRFADSRGFAICVSCGKASHWKSLHAGHFVSRVRLATRWDPENVNPQCPRDNIFLAGNAVGYARWLENRYGPSIFAALDERSRRPMKFSRGDLQAMIEEYSEKLKGLASV